MFAQCADERTLTKVLPFPRVRLASSRVRRYATLADFCATSKSRRKNGVARW
jgi:hypothetical protein